jgi:hypothetical protein
LGFGSPNLNLNSSMTILTLEFPSSNTSSIIFFPIYIYKIVIWFLIATTVVPTFGTKEPMTHSQALWWTQMWVRNENNRKARNWGTFPGLQHFWGRGVCWSFGMGLGRMTCT